MRRKEFSSSRDWAVQQLRQARTIHFAGTTEAGRVVLRTLNPIVLGDWVYFHGSPKGEKTQCVGRAAVLQCEREVVTIPSYFIDPENACPATTYYQSVQVHGVLQQIFDVETKAQVLSRLMEEYQPEGGCDPIRASNPRYRAALRNLGIFGVPLDDITGKSKLGQNRTTEQLHGITRGLWQRGAPGDLVALHLLLSDNPRAQWPEFLLGPCGVKLCVAPTTTHGEQVAEMLEGQYWTEGYCRAQRVAAHRQSPAWLVALDLEGRCIASARATGDGARHALLADVIVHESWRGRGLGRRLVQQLLDHPHLRNTSNIALRTVDAMPFYERFGFRAVREQEWTSPVGSPQTTDGLLARAVTMLRYRPWPTA